MYLPGDDSILFADFLKKYFSTLSIKEKKSIKYLDMGSGSGILAEIAVELGLKKENVSAADINQECVEYANKKGIRAIKSDLFKELNGCKYDLITFNAPYLPEEQLSKFEPKESKIATTGGKEGDEISLRFLKESKKHLNVRGKVFLLISSLTPRNRIIRFKPKIVAEKKLFFEELFILGFSFKDC